MISELREIISTEKAVRLSESVMVNFAKERQRIGHAILNTDSNKIGFFSALGFI